MHDLPHFLRRPQERLAVDKVRAEARRTEQQLLDSKLIEPLLEQVGVVVDNVLEQVLATCQRVARLPLDLPQLIDQDGEAHMV